MQNALAISVCDNGVASPRAILANRVNDCDERMFHEAPNVAVCCDTMHSGVALLDRPAAATCPNYHFLRKGRVKRCVTSLVRSRTRSGSIAAGSRGHAGANSAVLYVLCCVLRNYFRRDDTRSQHRHAVSASAETPCSNKLVIAGHVVHTLRMREPMLETPFAI